MFLPQPENYGKLWNAKLFPVADPFGEDTGKDDNITPWSLILWLASTGVSEITSQQKLTRFEMMSHAHL